MKIENKILLITGGTGSFGHAVLNRFLSTDHFHEIRIFSRDEKKQDDMRSLPDTHKSCALRLPIKVDIRDLSTWLSGKDPFHVDLVDLPTHYTNSLEGFLSALITHYSGGISFSVSDLIAISKICSISS